MLIYFSNSELRNETVVIQLMVAEVHTKLVKLGAGPQLAQLGSPLQRTSSASSSLPSPSVGITAVTGIVPMPEAMKKACRILLRHCLVRECLMREAKMDRKGEVGFLSVSPTVRFSWPTMPFSELPVKERPVRPDCEALFTSKRGNSYLYPLL